MKKTKRLTPCQSIKKFCIECAGSYNEARDCTANEAVISKVDEEERAEFPICPLHPYRLGHRPKIHASTHVVAKKN